jgi:hypothetical protein
MKLFVDENIPSRTVVRRDTAQSISRAESQ